MPMLVLAGAVLLDLAFGEPPNAIHPVAWIGRVIGGFTRRRPCGRPAAEFCYGLVVTLVCVGLALAAGVLAVHFLAQAPQWAQVAAGALLLKPLFAIRALPAAAMVVGRSLERGDLPGAQSALKALVSRDPNLPEPLVVSAAVESVAENLCDSVVAPLLYFALFGLPGAAAYRAANTLDAMIGYRGEYEWYGKAAARLDDVLNFVPGRIAGLLLCAGAALAAPRITGHGPQTTDHGPRTTNHRERERCCPLTPSPPHPVTPSPRHPGPGPGARAWKSMCRQARTIASPNAGWSMAAMAGALGVCLDKPGHYRLCGGSEDLRREHIAAANRAYAAAAGLTVALSLFVLRVGFHARSL